MPTLLRVLLIEDREDDSALILRQLAAAGFSPVHRRVDSEQALREALQERWDVIISDDGLPGFDAFGALRALQKAGQDIPFIIVSGVISEERAVEAMRAGAHDYLMKANLRRLGPAVRRELHEAALRVENAHTERSLRRLTERLRIADATSRDVLWDWEPAIDRVWVSDAMTRTFGHASGEQPVGQLMVHVHPDDRQQLVPPRAGDRWSAQYRLRKADGTYATVLHRAHVVRGPTGAPERWIGSLMDLSELKRSEQIRREAEASFRIMVDQSADLIAIQRKGVLLYVNPALLASFGYAQADQLVGKSVLELLLPSDRFKGVDLLIALAAVPTAELKARHASGSAIDVEVSTLPIVYDGEGAAMLVLRDLTAKNELTSRLVQMDRLSAMGTLAAGVGHEINTPLSVIAVNVSFLHRASQELLSEASLAAPMRESVHEMIRVLEETRDGLARVRDIAQDLNTFSRADETIGPVDLKRVLESAIHLAQGELQQGGRLSRDLDELPRVQANEGRLIQLFLNLLVNAAQAVRAKGGKGEIRLKARERAGNAVVEVIDNGPGIAPEHRARIFDPFFTTKPVGQGTGLGLHISMQIAQALGGAIEVESEPGRGSTFQIVLPAAHAPADPPRATPPLAPLAGRPRILYVDDEPMLGRAVRRLLAPQHDVVLLESAVAAVELLEKDPQFDAVLCDLLMPEMTGMELHDVLRAKKPELAQRMIFMTGGSFAPATNDFIERVENPCLLKPIDYEELRSAIRSMLDRTG